MAIQIRTSLDEIDTADAYVPHRPARPDKVEGGKRFELVSDYQPAGDQPTAIRELVRSEEHTSELQSLMRISYAVFCLKTKLKHPSTTQSYPAPPSITSYTP